MLGVVTNVDWRTHVVEDEADGAIEAGERDGAR